MAEPPPLMCPYCGEVVRDVSCVCGWYHGGVDEQRRAEWHRAYRERQERIRRTGGP
jgi:hypothetical protein